MANNTLFGFSFDAGQAAVLSKWLIRATHGLCSYGTNSARTDEQGFACATAGQAPVPPGGPLSTAANAQTPSPALTTVQSSPAVQAATAPQAATTRTYIPITQASGFSANPQPNRRDQSRLSMPAPPVRSNVNDLLIRMGFAGLRGAQESGLESMAAIGDAYSADRDLRTKNALESTRPSSTQWARKRAVTTQPNRSVRSTRHSLIWTGHCSFCKPLVHP